MAKLKASLHKVQMDKDGECKIILTVPLMCRESVLAVSMLTEKPLDVEIKEEVLN